MDKINSLVAVLGDGKANSQHASELEDGLDMDVGHTQEPTRDLIRAAIVNHEMPIGSTPRGYFLIDTEEELTEAIKNQQQRIEGIQNIINGLRRGWQRRQESRASGGNWPK